MLLIVKSFKILRKHNGWSFISGSFALNWYIFVALINKKLLLSLKRRFNTNLFPDCVKLIGYSVSAVIVVSSYPWVGLSPRTKILFFLLSTYTEELILTPKQMVFLSQLLSRNENCEHLSNLIP